MFDRRQLVALGALAVVVNLGVFTWNATTGMWWLMPFPVVGIAASTWSLRKALALDPDLDRKLSELLRENRHGEA